MEEEPLQINTCPHMLLVFFLSILGFAPLHRFHRMHIHIIIHDTGTFVPTHSDIIYSHTFRGGSSPFTLFRSTPTFPFIAKTFTQCTYCTTRAYTHSHILPHSLRHQPPSEIGLWTRNIKGRHEETRQPLKKV